MRWRRKYSYLANALLVIAIFSIRVAAQDRNIWNEYRLTITTAMPINDKWLVWQYTSPIYSPEKKVNTLAVSPPGIVYRPKKWLELWAGLIPSYNDNYHTKNSWELRPFGGIKVYVPNDKKLNIYNWGRYEYKFINQNNKWTSQPRYRNRIGVEIPLAKGEKRWSPKTYYTVGDVEPIWRLDDKFIERIRLRGTVGYIVQKRLSVEFIYHAEFAGPKGEPKKFSGNIWRLGLKFLFPRGKSIFPRIDMDE